MWLMLSVLASAQSDPFEWHVLSADVLASGRGEIVLSLEVPADHEVYADSVDVRVLDSGPFVTSRAVLPEVDAESDDPLSLTGLVLVRVPLRTVAYPGLAEVRLELRHRGCAPGLCYPGVVQERAVDVQVVSGERDESGR